ncbi:MAG: hypothetical protein IIA01_00215 [Proteobacteria bacterium]|nr:hypothetical protein [Pseudomonadota bacterium]
MTKAAKTRKRGRPSIYSDELAATICTRLAGGESLRRICGDDDMPGESTVHGWLVAEEHKDFETNYQLARQLQADRFADEILEISDDADNDFTAGEKGGKVVNHEHISRSRLRVDTRKWLMSKVAPKVYGDKLQHTGDLTVRYEDSLEDLK